MNLNTMRCKECHGAMALETLEPISGEEAGVRMRIEGMPVMACAGGHKRFVAPEFAVKLMDALSREDQLVPLKRAGQKGLLRTRSVCPACGKDLAAPPADSVELKCVLELRGLEAFGVRLEVPRLRCAACAAECVPPGAALADALMKASVQAFRSARVEPR